MIVPGFPYMIHKFRNYQTSTIGALFKNKKKQQHHSTLDFYLAIAYDFWLNQLICKKEILHLIFG